MEGMRGYAVLLVFLVHQHTLFGSGLRPEGVLSTLSQFGHHIGNSGVDLFFVLSGFLIYGHLLERSPSFLSFVRRRIHRIYPTFLFVLLLYVVLAHLFAAPAKLPPTLAGEVRYLVENVFLLPGILPIDPLITVTWSLSFEFFFYLSIPLIIGAFRMRAWPRDRRVAFFVALLACHAAGYWLGVLPHIRLTAFLSGVLLYEIHTAGWLSRKLGRSGEIAVLALYVAFFLIPGVETGSLAWSLALSAGLFGLTLYSFAFRGILQAVFVWTPIRWLGNISYSFFLMHGLVLHGIAFWLSGRPAKEYWSPLAYAGLIGFNLAAAFVVSLLLFLLVEKPFSLTSSQRRRKEPVEKKLAYSKAV